MVLLGVGAGLAFPSLMTLAMSGATRRTRASPRGWSTRRLQVGGALGLAVLATLSTTRTENLLAGGESQASALTGGYHLAFLIGAGLVAAAIAVALAVLRSAPALQEASELDELEAEIDREEPAYQEAA